MTQNPGAKRPFLAFLGLEVVGVEEGGAMAAETTPDNPLLRYVVSGGLRALISPVIERPKKVRNHADRMARAKASVITKLGLHQSIALKNSFDSLNVKASTKDAADGMIQAMFDLDFS
jgi:hypothetical protein